MNEPSENVDDTDRAPSEPVQPIILLVDKAEPAGEDAGIAAVALASVRAYLADPANPAWQVWADGAFAKTVRRADPKTFAKVLAEHPDHALVEVGTARAAGLPPMPADGLPKRIAKLQVSGTQLPEGGRLPDAPVAIVLNDSLGMSTGKAAAQGAHALLAWVLEAGRPEVAAWVDAGLPLTVRRLPAGAFEAGAARADGPLILDAGRTEIEPGSATAYVAADLAARP